MKITVLDKTFSTILADELGISILKNQYFKVYSFFKIKAGNENNYLWSLWLLWSECFISECLISEWLMSECLISEDFI